MLFPDLPPSHRPPLRRAELPEGPFELFARWFEQASAAGLIEPNAMALATADARGNPSVRMVLLKAYGEAGFVFYTNHESRKGRELEARPRAALSLWWPPLHRQVRIEGGVERVSAAESDRYFASRPLDSRLSAIASPQSQVVASREALIERRERVRAEFPDGDPPRPASWGGYRVHAERIEFWQMGPDRLHDRFLYTRGPSGWTLERLAP